MPSYCCFSSDFLQSHYTVLLSPIQFSFFVFMHLLMLLFTSLYFTDPSVSNLLFLSSLLMSHRSRISAAIQVFFLLMMFAKDLTGCFSHCYVKLKVVTIESMSVSSLFMIVRGANFLPIVAWKVSNTLGSFSFSR